MNTKQSNEFKYQNTHQDLLHMQHPLFYQSLSLEYTPLNSGSF